MPQRLRSSAAGDGDRWLMEAANTSPHTLMLRSSAAGDGDRWHLHPLVDPLQRRRVAILGRR